jgi:hypothetical protein
VHFLLVWCSSCLVVVVCVTRAPTHSSRIIAYALAGLALVLSLAVIISFLRYPSLRKFPSELNFWRAICDFLFAAQFISFQLGTPSASVVPSELRVIAANTDLDDNSPDAEQHIVNCGTSAFFMQFAGLGSLSWFFCSTFNFYQSVTNPFKRPQSRVKLFHVWVWTLSFCTAAIAANKAKCRIVLSLQWLRNRCLRSFRGFQTAKTCIW